MTLNPISHYCKDLADWDKFSYENFTMVDPQKFPPEMEPYFSSFVNKKIGIQCTCGVYDTHIHVSICPVVSLGIKKEVSEGICKEIISGFFGDLHFIRMVDDPKNPRMKHFFHYFYYPFANN